MGEMEAELMKGHVYQVKLDAVASSSTMGLSSLIVGFSSSDEGIFWWYDQVKWIYDGESPGLMRGPPSLIFPLTTNFSEISRHKPLESERIEPTKPKYDVVYAFSVVGGLG